MEDRFLGFMGFRGKSFHILQHFLNMSCNLDASPFMSQNPFLIDQEGAAFDAQMLLVAVGLSLLAGLVAGVYPAWRVCRIAPAIHLKVQ